MTIPKYSRLASATKSFKYYLMPTALGLLFVLSGCGQGDVLGVNPDASVICGDGVLDATEQCDDGNAIAGDGCDGLCLSETAAAVVCGDGVLDATEQCDDGNTAAGDGCDGLCLSETPAGPACGDGVLDATEQCDDGNVVDGDGCSATCFSIAPICGDGFVNDSTEFCDDGNAVDDDDCNNSCRPPVAIQVAVGGFTTCVLKKNGRVTCWGLNNSGQLGYGHKLIIGDDPGETPAAAALSGLGGDVDIGERAVQITVGGAHVCALLETGNVRCWGEAGFGQLGYGNRNDIGEDPGETPASVGDVPVGGPVVQITAGKNHTCALMATGHVRCWGNGSGGALGYSSHILQAGGVDLPQDLGDEAAETPALVGDADVGGGIIQIAAGDQFTCARYDTGSVRCWGEGSLGRLGYADAFENISPFLDLQEDLGDQSGEMSNMTGFVPLGDRATDIATGGVHACAFSPQPLAAVRCWGFGGGGRLGNQSTNNVGDDAGETPEFVQAATLGLVINQVEAGGEHTCTLLDGGAVICWGRGTNGRLGYGNEDDLGDNEFPGTLPAVPVGGTVSQISLGLTSTCALLSNGDVRCWGRSVIGELGYGNVLDVGDTASNTPDKVGNVNISGWICGNGVKEPTEGCDDGNNLGGDGCSAGCLVE